MKNSILSLLVVLITISASAQSNYSINGNLGLDTIPENKLDVNGDAKFYGDVKVDHELFMDALKSTSPLFEQLVFIDENGRMQRLGEGGARTVIEALTTLPCRDLDDQGNPIPGTVYWNSNPGKITAYDQACGSPDVGIGTDNPTARLDVRGKGRFTEQLAIGGSNQGNSYLYVRSHPLNPSIVVKDFDEETELFSVAADGSLVSSNHEIKANETITPGLKILKKESDASQYGVITVVDDNVTKSYATYNENEAKDVFAVRGNGKIEIKAAEPNQNVFEVKSSDNDQTLLFSSSGQITMDRTNGNENQFGFKLLTGNNELKALNIRNEITNVDHLMLWGDGRIDLKMDGGDGDKAIRVRNLNLNPNDNDVFFVRNDGSIESGKHKIKATELNQKVIEVKNSENDETFRLLSDGTLYLTAVHVRLPEDFPDYVFEPGYKLMPLDELERHIKEHQRLPNMPSAEEVSKNGVDLGEMNRLLVEKVEELTLYILDMEERLKVLESK
jgi:hypothetical protein